MLNYNNSFYIIVFLFSFYLILVSLFGITKNKVFLISVVWKLFYFKKENLFSEVMRSIMRFERAARELDCGTSFNITVIY